MNEPRRVLVVDDDPQVRELMRWALADEGFDVVSAADGREALERIADTPPRLAVLDVGLPFVDGFAVAEALHALAVPVLMVTADGRAAHKAARMRAFRYLRKPFALEELIAGVRAGLAT